VGATACALLALPGLSSAAPGFLVFDALLYRGKGNLGRYGIQPLPTLYDLWRPDSPHDAIDPAAMGAALKALPDSTSLYFIDIEYWPFLKVGSAERDSSISKLLKVARIARSARPGARFGFYNVPPVGTYWPVLLPQTPEHQEWLRANRALDVVATAVDALFPSLYTFYDDPRSWMTVAAGIVAEARRYSKPIYPFLWPQFHEGGDPALAGTEVPAEFWAAQLRFCRQHADGVVLWGGYQQPWDDRATWWKTTLSTLKLRPA